MAKVKPSTSSTSSRKIRPALTPEARENQLISLAMDLVQQRLLDGTASSQETTHFLKLASSKSRMENEILEMQKELVAAKTENIRSAKRSEELYEKAFKAFRGYRGLDDDEEPGENFDEY